MSLETIFNKSSKAVVQEFKTTAQIMINNNSEFSCQSLSITGIDGEDTVFPSSEYMIKWVENLFQIEIKLKPLNQKALEEMAKKGIIPKKQPSDIILVVVIPSTTHVHIGISIPEGLLSTITAIDFLKSSISSYTYTIIENTIGNTTNKMVFAKIEHLESLKERDVVLRCFFSELKNRKIYIDDEDEDEEIYYME